LPLPIPPVKPTIRGAELELDKELDKELDLELDRELDEERFDFTGECHGY
jgi:hypothetical protein